MNTMKAAVYTCCDMAAAADDAEPTVEVHLVGLGEQVVTVAIERSKDVAGLKRKVMDEKGLNTREQRILDGTTELKDDQKLNDIFPADATAVQYTLLVSLPDGMASWSQYFADYNKRDKERRFAEARALAEELNAMKAAAA